MSMSVAERKLITKTWVKAVKKTKQHLMIQVGGAPLPDVIELVGVIINICGK
jgi:N-acetylneuraminate lyase